MILKFYQTYGHSLKISSQSERELYKFRVYNLKLKQNKEKKFQYYHLKRNKMHIKSTKNKSSKEILKILLNQYKR